MFGSFSNGKIHIEALRFFFLVFFGLLFFGTDSVLAQRHRPGDSTDAMRSYRVRGDTRANKNHYEDRKRVYERALRRYERDMRRWEARVAKEEIKAKRKREQKNTREAQRQERKLAKLKKEHARVRKKREELLAKRRKEMQEAEQVTFQEYEAQLFAKKPSMERNQWLVPTSAQNLPRASNNGNGALVDGGQGVKAVESKKTLEQLERDVRVPKDPEEQGTSFWSTLKRAIW